MLSDETLRNMNAKLNAELIELVKAHEWKKLLRKLPPNEAVPLVFDSVQDMNNIRSVASRLNSMGEDDNRYSFSGLNYISKTIAALATPKSYGTNSESL